MPKTRDQWQSRTSFITGLANCGTSFFAGFVVFSMLGYLAKVQGLPVSEVTASGTGLAFVAFLTAISQLPALNCLFGMIFFIALLTLGIDSAFALQEAFTTGFHDKWGIPTQKLAGIFVLIAFPVSLIFVTRAGFFWFDIVDKWICDFGLVISGLFQCIAVGFLYPVQEFREYLNSQSEIRLGRWWIWALRYITPGVLLVILVGNLVQEITGGYSGYPRWATLIGGWGTVLFWGLLGYFLWKLPQRSDQG